MAIDDTLVEKSGTVFENCSCLFDHTRKNGSNYLNGHCFVSAIVNIPVQCNQGAKYLPVPIGYRMWDKSKSKLQIAAEMVRNAMQVIGKKHQVILCCDSWYPKEPITALPNEYSNLTLICNARIDTALYDLPPEPTGKRGRPKVFGERIRVEALELTDITGTAYSAKAFPAKTRLFGERTIYAIVTKPQQGSTRRLFLCTSDPSELNFKLELVQNPTNAAWTRQNSLFLPLTIYSLRWNIEVTYYEQKTFWSLGDYMLQHRTGIERLVNLISLLFAALRLLPFQSEDFSALSSISTQEARFVLGRLINQQVFFTHLASLPESPFNSSDISAFLKYQ